MSEVNSQIISISLPLTLAKAVDDDARKTKQSKSQIFQEAVKQYLWLKEWNALQAYGMEQAIRLGIKPQDVESLIDEYRNETRTRST